MRRAKETKSKNLPKKLTPQEFIQNLATKQNELLMSMVQCIQNGEFSLDVDDCDEVVDSIVEVWCEQQEPDYGNHLKMLSAVFLWALLDQVEQINVTGEPRGMSFDDSELDFDKVQYHPGVVITLEMLKTVRSIWGQGDGRKSR